MKSQKVGKPSALPIAAKANKLAPVEPVAEAEHALFTLNGFDFIEQPAKSKRDSPKLKLSPPESPKFEDTTLQILFDIAQASDKNEKPPLSSTWDSFNTDIRDFLLEVTPQTEQEEARNEKLVSFLFLDKGDRFADKYIEHTENNVYDLNGAGVCLSIDYLLSCLSLLVCGHQSSLFVLNGKKLIFTTSSVDVKFRASGLTSASLADITDFCLSAGSRLERLKYTSKVIYKNADTAGPILVAFANCINVIVEAVANFVNEHKTSRLIDFYNMIQLPVSVITMMAELLGCDDLSKSLALNRLPSSWKLLNALYRRCDLLESANEKLYQLVKLVLKSASDQWFDKLEDFIGLGEQFSQFWRDLDEKKITDFFIKVTSDLGINLFAVDEKKVPDFFTLGLAERSVDIMNCLLLLAQYSNETVMLHLQELKKVKLRWNSGKELQKQILAYHKDVIAVRSSILRNAPLKADKFRKEVVTSVAPTIVQECLATLDAMDDVIPFMAKLSVSEKEDPSSLKSLCYDLFNSTSEAPALHTPIQAATNVAVGDLIFIQSWLMNSLTFKIVFDQGERKLRDHMVLVREIMLLGSGLFVFDLEDMLFGSLNSTKLPLMSSLNIGAYGNDPGRRIDWPPSSAETNRALPHCVEKAIASLDSRRVCDEVRALECINFGLRQLPSSFSGDPLSLDATSVFYLAYNPPHPISIVISREARVLYNKVFGSLLKVMHVKYAMKKLSMQSRRGQEMQASHFAITQSVHFLNTLGHHFSSVVIDHIWKSWEDYLDNKVFSDKEDTETAVGLSELISRHNQVTADLSACFFETQETAHLAEAINTVLTSILKLVKLVLNSPPGNPDKIRKTEADIHEGISLFLKYLCESIEAGGNSISSELGQLLAPQLTYNGFYAVM